VRLHGDILKSPSDLEPSMRHPIRFLSVLVLCALAPAVHADGSNAETLRKLTALGERGSAAAQYNVGMFYNNGIGTAEDPRAAFGWFQRAAAGGDALGHYKVGCYYAGQFPGAVEVDEAKALAAKTVAAEAGYSLAQSDVGNSHAQKGDWPQAVKWWAAAAEQGYAQAAYNLSMSYQRGQGVARDPAQALKYMLITERSTPEAMRPRLAATLTKVRGEATAAQISQAETAVAAWSPKPTPLTLRARNGIREVQELLR
jgi:hypothetical protein